MLTEVCHTVYKGHDGFEKSSGILCPDALGQVLRIQPVLDSMKDPNENESSL
jgi:hypothetical protein